MLFAGQWGYQTEYQTGSEPGLGLQYLEQRYYDPVIGRFLSPDPIGFLGGLNLYSYLENDPVNGVDPSGLQAEDEQAIAAEMQRRATTVAQANRALRQIGSGLQTGVEIVGTANLGANAALAINDAGEGRRAQALARVIPVAKWLGRGARWLKGCFRRKPGGTVTGTAAQFIVRPTGEILDVAKIVIPGPRNSPLGKLDYLLGRVVHPDSVSKGRIFAGTLGFTDSSLDAALRSHLIHNFGSASITGGRIRAVGTITGPSGRTVNILSAWQVRPGGTVELITAHPH